MTWLLCYSMCSFYCFFLLCIYIYIYKYEKRDLYIYKYTDKTVP